MTYYRVRLTISGKLNNVEENFRLIPRMELQVEIKTDTHPVIHYLIYTLLKALDESFREP